MKIHTTWFDGQRVVEKTQRMKSRQGAIYYTRAITNFIRFNLNKISEASGEMHQNYPRLTLDID